MLLPLLSPAILTALVLVFVDTIKELSATILLRPFGFNTLATFVYENASRGVPEEGALGGDPDHPDGAGRRSCCCPAR